MTADHAAALEAAQETLDVAQEAAAEAVRARDAAILAALAAGLGPSRIADILGVERQTVYKVKRRG